MRKILLLSVTLLVSLMFNACNCDSDKGATTEVKELVSIEKDKTIISELLDELALGIENGNISAIKKVWCIEDGTLLLGTENTEKLEGWNAIEKAFSGQFNTLSDMLIAINDQDVKVNKAQNTAWFYEELSYNFVQDNKAVSYDEIRFTGVFVKNKDGHWKLVQGHMSIPSNYVAK